jgi:hypothetical protein
MKADSSGPMLARIVAGSVKGSTQQAPQASAPVDNVIAAAPAAFAPGGSFVAGFVELAQAHGGVSVQVMGCISAIVMSVSFGPLIASLPRPYMLK